jgi:hypothetical protein
MIRVIIPKNNANLVRDLNDDIISNIVFRLFNTKKFEKVEENRQNGRYITITDAGNHRAHFVCFSNPESNSRNARLMQFVSPAYTAYHECDFYEKYIHIYVLKPFAGNDKTPYIKMFYRCFLTIGIDILNLGELELDEIIPFKSYGDLQNYRNTTSGRNSHNRSTYFTDDESQISIYGKTFGANAMESFLLALTIREIVPERTIVFYPVIDNESKNLSELQVEVLSHNNISIADSIKLQKNGYAKPINNTSIRDTPRFHYNLLQKFDEKRCYLCGCDIEHLIIGSHIERIVDIEKCAMYSDEEKDIHAIDSDNGFWLCANHDKMFEFGVLYFSNRLLQISASIDDDLSYKFIENSIFETSKIFSENLENIGEINYEKTTFTIQEKHYNAKIAGYLDKHSERVQ